jgi:DNA-binding GntR family transcriptional regulator
VVRLRRVRLADGVAVSFDETYLPREIGEKVVGSDLEEVSRTFSLRSVQIRAHDCVRIRSGVLAR